MCRVVFMFGIFVAASSLELSRASNLTVNNTFPRGYLAKVNVRVSDLLSKNQDQQPEDRSWPPENAQEFAKIDIRVMGQKIDSATLHNLKPDTGRSKTRKLRRILATDFQSDWMASETPPERQTRVQTPPVPDARLEELVLNFNFTFSDSAGAVLELQPDMMVMFRQWMVHQASCPMDYIWEDLGLLFWPRWIKRGVCLNNRSCSWPPGMRCRPSVSRKLTLLHWVCASDGAKRKTKRSAPKLRPASGSGRSWRKKSQESGQVGGKRLTREERQKRRMRRLIRETSLSAHGYRCEWTRHEYIVSEQCSCSCPSF